LFSLKKRAAAVAAGAALMGGAAIMAAGTASASTVGTYASTGGYQFASNYQSGSSSVWQVSDSPITQATASEKLSSNGVDLAAGDDTAKDYSSAAVIVDLGKLSSLFDSSGTYVAPKVVGSSNLAVNYYFDTNGNGAYLSFSYNGFYQGPGGDNLASISGDTADFTTFSQGDTSLGLSGQKTMEDVLAAYKGRASGTTDPEVWAWAGVQNGPAATGYVTSVGGKTFDTGTPRCADSLAGNCGDYQNVYGNGINVKGAVARTGGAVIAYPNENNSGDDFLRQSVLAGGYYRLQFAPFGKASGYCVADPNNPALGSAANAVVTNPCNNGDWQEWSVSAKGQLVNKADGRVLQPQGTSAQMVTVKSSTVAGSYWTWKG
jgi:hypothetical protein